jgi:ppGpp synthetase/RelA/SpoT-type nucleotidyltranferase
VTDLSRLRDAYLEKQEEYEEVAAAVKAAADGALVGTGITYKAIYRVKDTASFLRKCLLHPVKQPLRRWHDLAGVRVVVPRSSLVPVAAQAVAGALDVVRRDDKSANLGPSELGYLGVHIDVRLRPPAPARLRRTVCEVQIQTDSQRIWADLAHPLLYKTPKSLPVPLQRQAYGLASLLEAVDQRIEYVHQMAFNEPGFIEGRILDALERSFVEFRPLAYSAELSLYVVHGLKELYDVADQQNYDGLLRPFVKKGRSKLAKIYGRQPASAEEEVFLHQPESLMIFQSLARDPFLTTEAWDQILPRDALTELALRWGVPIPD